MTNKERSAMIQAIMREVYPTMIRVAFSRYFDRNDGTSIMDMCETAVAWAEGAAITYVDFIEENYPTEGALREDAEKEAGE